METVTLLALGGIVILLLLSGFFSGSETALTAASRPRMHQLETEGNKRAKLVNGMRDHRDRMIAAILLGNNLVNILASALATSILITSLGEAGIVYATAAMTVLILIFGEILPKTYAFRNAARAALTLAPTLRVVIAVLAPISDMVQAIIRITFRLFGVDLKQGEEWAAPEEDLRGAIELHDEGPESRQQRAMLRSILDLDDAGMGKQITVACVARGHDTVEHVDSITH